MILKHKNRISILCAEMEWIAVSYSFFYASII
nr:MAG TPA: hypothetical protein [Caudoviricetes sp.]